MKKILILITLSLFLSPLFGQVADSTIEKSKPVRFTFGTTTLIENNTTETPYKGGLELEIKHRFSQYPNRFELWYYQQVNDWNRNYKRL